MSTKAISPPHCHYAPSSLCWMAGHFDFLSFHIISEFRIHYFKVVFSLDSISFLFPPPQSGLQWHGIGGWGYRLCLHTSSFLTSPNPEDSAAGIMEVHLGLCGES